MQALLEQWMGNDQMQGLATADAMVLIPPDLGFGTLPRHKISLVATALGVDQRHAHDECAIWSHPGCGLVGARPLGPAAGRHEESLGNGVHGVHEWKLRMASRRAWHRGLAALQAVVSRRKGRSWPPDPDINHDCDESSRQRELYPETGHARVCHSVPAVGFWDDQERLGMRSPSRVKVSIIALGYIFVNGVRLNFRRLCVFVQSDTIRTHL